MTTRGRLIQHNYSATGVPHANLLKLDIKAILGFSRGLSGSSGFIRLLPSKPEQILRLKPNQTGLHNVCLIKTQTGP